MLSPEHEVKAALLNEIREKMTRLTHVRDVSRESVYLESPYVEDTLLEQVSLSDGKVRIRIAVKDIYYYQMLSEMSGISMESEYELIQTMKEEKKICHYLDLPIQHASDRILKRMGRRTTQQNWWRL